MSTLSKAVVLGNCVLASALLAYSGSSDSLPASNSAANGEETPQAPNLAAPPSGQQQPAASPPAPVVKQPPTLVDHSRAAEVVIRRAMQLKIDTTFTDKPLKDFIGFLAEQGGIPVWIDEAALAEEGMALDEPLTDELHDATIEQALDWMLAPLRLTWLIEDGILKVTTDVAAGDRRLTRTYDVSKLRIQTNIQLGHPAEFDHCGLACLNRSGFDNSGRWLIDVLQSGTNGAWMARDGGGGSVVRMGDTIAVRQTYAVHREVSHLLQALESAAAGKAKLGSIAVRRETYPHQDDAAIRAALTKKTSVDFRDRKLSAIAAEIAQRHKIRVRIKRRPLSEEGVATDEPVTLTLNDVTLGGALAVMLEPLGLTTYISDGTLWITTEIDAEEIQYTTVYDVRDLIGSDRDYDSLIELIQQAMPGPWVHLDVSAWLRAAPPLGAIVIRHSHQGHQEVSQLLADLRATIAAQPKAEVRKPDPHAVVVRVYQLPSPKFADDLVTAIPRFVSPGSWNDDNPEAAIQIVGNTLVIRQTQEVHDKIASFLHQAWIVPGSGSVSHPSHLGPGFF